MPFEGEFTRRALRARQLSEVAYALRCKARVAAEELNEMHATRRRIENRLDALWKSANKAYSNSRVARYGSNPGRVRACSNRYDLLSRIIDEVSDTLLDLQEKIDAVEDLRVRAEAATMLADQEARKLKAFGEDRKRLVARLAGVPSPQLEEDAFVARINSRDPDKLDVYYNLPGLEPLGEGHGHIVLGFDGTVREHRPPVERTLQRTIPKPGPLLFRKTPQEVSVPLAA